jgi:hypothetical protein
MLGAPEHEPLDRGSSGRHWQQPAASGVRTGRCRWATDYVRDGAETQFKFRGLCLSACCDLTPGRHQEWAVHPFPISRCRVHAAGLATPRPAGSAQVTRHLKGRHRVRFAAGLLTAPTCSL